MLIIHVLGDSVNKIQTSPFEVVALEVHQVLYVNKKNYETYNCILHYHTVNSLLMTALVSDYFLLATTL